LITPKRVVERAVPIRVWTNSTVAISAPISKFSNHIIIRNSKYDMNSNIVTIEYENNSIRVYLFDPEGKTIQSRLTLHKNKYLEIKRRQ
jgi:hypothetical protein